MTSAIQVPPSGRSFSWDRKDQPPMNAIAQAVRELSAKGVVHMIAVDTESDDHACVISNQLLTGAEAREVYDANIYEGEI
jgi:hypothetical protein